MFLIKKFDIYRILAESIYQIRKVKENNNLSLSVSKMIIAKEFSTIRFSLSRRAGHTTAIEKLVENKIVKNPLIISPHGNIQLKHIRLKQIKSQAGKNFGSIILDDFSSVSTDKVDEIYEKFSYLALDPEFVFLFIH